MWRFAVTKKSVRNLERMSSWEIMQLHDGTWRLAIEFGPVHIDHTFMGGAFGFDDRLFDIVKKRPYLSIDARNQIILTPHKHDKIYIGDVGLGASLRDYIVRVAQTDGTNTLVPHRVDLAAVNVDEDPIAGGSRRKTRKSTRKQR